MRTLSFNREAATVAAEIQQANPTGLNPLERKALPCVDCGRMTRSGYICAVCASTHAAPVRG